jgi:hypothetical protein
VTLWMDETPPVDPPDLPLFEVKIHFTGQMRAGHYAGRIRDIKEVLNVAKGLWYSFPIWFGGPPEAVPQLNLGEEVDIELTFPTQVYNFSMIVDRFLLASLGTAGVEYELVSKTFHDTRRWP